MSGGPPSPEAPTSLGRPSRQSLETTVRLQADGPLATREDAAALCEAAGRLSLGGAAPTALADASRERLLARLSDGLGLEPLADDANLLVEMLDELDDDEAAGERPSRETEEVVREALAMRDRAEWIQEGARCLLGATTLGGAGLADSDALAIATFDETLRAELPRLTRWNHVRGEGLASASSEEKRRFRWRSEGVEIDPEAWGSMSAVAALVAAQASAAQRFDALVAAARSLEAMRATKR
ncbi:MAG: hypothetical protein ACK6CU_20830 [Deltaproteobacteria bacterium]|jgi:hypothetical protein